MKGEIPGEAGIWVLIFGDLLVFGVFFATFAFYRLQQPALFRASQQTLEQSLGILNTLLLLTSSLFLVLGIHAARTDRPSFARRWILLTMALGLCFIAVKALEYSDKIHAGIYPVANNFYMLYFAFTGIHLVHVTVGLGVLAFLRSRIAVGSSASNLSIIESCALFWHLVDILWVVLFAIFYLHR